MAEIFHKGEIDMSDVAEKAAALAGAAAATATGASAATIVTAGAAIAVIGYGIYELGKWIGRKRGRSEAEKEFKKKLEKVQQELEKVQQERDKFQEDDKRTHDVAFTAITESQELKDDYDGLIRDYKELKAAYELLKAQGKTDLSVDQMMRTVTQGFQVLVLQAKSA